MRRRPGNIFKQRSHNDPLFLEAKYGIIGNYTTGEGYHYAAS